MSTRQKLFMILSLAVVLCFAFSCQQAEEAAEEPAVDIETEEAAVEAFIDDYLEIFKTEDMEMLSKMYAHDDDMVVFGTDAAEHFIGWESMKESMQKQFDALDMTEVAIRKLSIKVHKSGEVAWASFLMDAKGEAMGEPFEFEGSRFTGVLEKRNGNWVFVQVHFSVPVEGQAVKY